MKRKIAILIALASAGAALQAQIPTIDVSSLQQLYAQYQTMQQQLSTAKNIVSTSTSILNQEQSIYNNALGNVSRIHPPASTRWLSSFLAPEAPGKHQGNWFSNYTLTPVQSFNNNVGYWANQIGGGRSVVDMQTCWQTSISNVNNGTANKTSRTSPWQATMPTWWTTPAPPRPTAATSCNQSQTGPHQSGSSTNGGTNGTLIQQAAAQNTLIYQQTALLDKMKNDINDATVAEAAQRDQKLKKKRRAGRRGRG